MSTKEDAAKTPKPKDAPKKKVTISENAKVEEKKKKKSGDKDEKRIGDGRREHVKVNEILVVLFIIGD